MTARSPAASHPYSLASIRQTLGLSRHAIQKLIELGFVEPAREGGRAYRFSFRDVVLLRSAHELRAAGVPTRQLLRSLGALRADLPADVPVDGLRIVATGDRLAVRLDGIQWEPETGQLVMDFAVAPGTREVSFIPQRPAADAVAAQPNADRLFAEAERLEESDAAGAEATYRHVIAMAPAHAHAYLNLGFMLCEAHRCGEALAVYEAGLTHCADDPLLHYNRAVALEALGQTTHALASYEECLRLQPDIADAHHNAALLYAQGGEKQLAIRHFSAYRRLQAG